MAKKISQLGLAGDVATNDLLSVLDVSDQFMAPTGTNKRITAQTFGNFLPVTATGSSASRTLKDRFADTVNVKDFGAVGDGVTDDTAAFNAAYAACPTIGRIIIPAGTYAFQSSISFTLPKKVSWEGAGSRQTILKYVGANTTNDIFTFGNNVNEQNGLRLSGISFISDTLMTGGTGVRFNGFTRSACHDVLFDHQDGTGRFYHGVWFNGCDASFVSIFQARAQQDAIRVNGGLGKAGLYFTNGKVGGATVGVHMGGNFGGLQFENVDIINSKTNVLIDKTLNPIANREIVFGSCVSVDSACNSNDANTFDGINIDIQDTGGFIILKNTWVASAGTNIRIGSQFGGTLKIDGGINFNAFTVYGGNGRSIDNASLNASVIINGTLFLNAQGAGIYSSVETSNFFLNGVKFNSNVVLPVSSNLITNSSWNYLTENVAIQGKVAVGALNVYPNGVNLSPDGAFHGKAWSYQAWCDTVGNPWISIGHSRGSTAGTHVSLVDSDQLGGISFEGSDGIGFCSGAAIASYVEGTPTSGHVTAKIKFKTDSGSNVTDRIVISSSGNFQPETDNSYSIGISGKRWSAIWSANGVIQTSDERTKTDIETSQLGLDFINDLEPVSYKFSVGGNKVIRQVYRDAEGNEVDQNVDGAIPSEVLTEEVEGKRTHYGLLAQQVKSVLPEGADFGGWILTDKDDPESQQGLRYEEFISPIIKAIQELSAKVALLESK